MHHRILLCTLAALAWSNCGLLPTRSAPPPADPTNAAPLGSAAASKASDAEIADWLRELAAPEYAVRRGAFLQLWSQGEAALPAVRQAASASDQQTVETGKVLEVLLKLGIKPQDNEELAEFLQLSRSATPRAILTLAEKGHWRLATELLKSNEAALTAYRNNPRQEWLSVVVQSAFDQGDATLAWPVLELLLSPVQRQWIAEHAHLEIDVDGAAPTKDEEALALLFRGEFDKAWAVAQSLTVRQRIVFVSGRWEWLKHEGLRALMLTADPQSLAGRAQAAAYAYLADDVAKSDELLAEVLREMKSDNDNTPKPDAAPRRNGSPFDSDALERRDEGLMMSLLICGEADALHDMLMGQNQREHLVYFVSRLEYDQALKAFDLKPDLSNFGAWLDGAMAKLRPGLKLASPSRGLDEFQQLCDLSALLVSMGKTSEGLQLFNRLIDATQIAPPVYQDRSWSYLASQSRQTQFRPHLIAILDQRATELSPEARERLFNSLYPDWSFIAAALWRSAPEELVEATRTLKEDSIDQRSAAEATSDGSEHQGSETGPADASDETNPQEGRWQLMERLWRFDRQLVTEHQSGAVVEAWLKTAWRESSRMAETAPYAASQLSALALHLGLRDLGQTLAISGKGATAVADGAAAMMQKNALSQAAEWWDQAVRSDPRQHEWLLKYISVCSMIGEEEKAQTLERSRWLRPLAVERSGLSYLMVANNLEEEGMLEQARQYGQAAFEMLEPDNPQMLITARIYAEILQELEDFARSADVHRAANAALLTLPETGYPISVIQHFVAEEFLARAVAELEQGEVDSALDRIKRFERLRPAGIEICEHTYARLVDNGRQDAADDLFERCSRRMLEHLERWPDDAGSHNNLAWMYARCDQRLEEALGHAELAVRLSSGAATYIDTLAEVHFRLGHVDEALELAEQCVKLDPRHHHYRKQLERFREARK